ncbi:hypothetical protein FX982_04100 [Pseudomonas graminis]|uniref:Uncharacterized protein n=1 Tax=Pseudomonas graminis TaxID=158627 RepID=A0A6M8MWB7_9PSED|nr:hypothetical protein FX982_04100 [Pseudomonas graminis]
MKSEQQHAQVPRVSKAEHVQRGQIYLQRGAVHRSVLSDQMERLVRRQKNQAEQGMYFMTKKTYIINCKVCPIAWRFNYWGCYRLAKKSKALFF